MYKLKLVNKPNFLRLKCNFSFPEIVLANLQTKEVVPSKEVQEVKADPQYDGLSKVTVDKIPDEYIIPASAINIVENGTYDVKEKASAIVNVPVPVLGTKTITQNGIYKASDDNLDGYSEVDVQTSGVDIWDYYSQTSTYSEIYSYIKTIPLIDTSRKTNLNNMFGFCRNLVSIPLIDTSNATNMGQMFQYCSSLLEVPEINTSKNKTMGYMFDNCISLINIPKLDCSQVTSIESAFGLCTKLENLGGLQNLGEAYLTTRAENYYAYKIDLSSCRSLTHDSLMNVINNLYDIATKGVKVQTLQLGSTNINKLTAEEIAIATGLGWSVS